MDRLVPADNFLLGSRMTCGAHDLLAPSEVHVGVRTRIWSHCRSSQCSMTLHLAAGHV